MRRHGVPAVNGAPNMELKRLQENVPSLSLQRRLHVESRMEACSTGPLVNVSWSIFGAPSLKRAVVQGR